MKTLLTRLGTAAVLLTLAAPALAAAETAAMPQDDAPGEGKHAGEPPAAKAADQAPPPQVTPTTPQGGIVRQAGVGGETSYARAGVLELGGSAFLAHATDLTQVNLSPSIGWFFMDNLEISAILGIHYSHVAGVGRTYASALVEPSFHVPFTDQAFGFLGVGMGMAFAEGPGAGFALAPRLGANLLVGRSGVLTPALHVTYATHDAQTTPNGVLLGVSVSYGLGLGYTVLW